MMHKKVTISSIYAKLFVSFFVFAIPILFISFMMATRASKMLKNEFQEKLQDNFHYTVKSIDTEMNQIRNNMISILYNPSYTSFLQPYSLITPDIWVDIDQITNVLITTRTAYSDLIDNIFYYLDSEKVYNINGVDDFDDFFTRFYQYDGYPAAYWKALLPKTPLKQMLMPVNVRVPLQTLSSEKKVISFSSSLFLHGHNIIVTISFDYDRLFTRLSQNNLFPETGYLVTDSKGNVIYSSLPDTISSANASAYLDNNDEFFVCESLLSFLDYNIKSVTPICVFNRYFSRAFFLLLTASVAFAFAALLVAVVFANSVYRPINKISRFVQENTKSLQPQGKSEIELISSGMQFLVQQKNFFHDKMLSTMEKYAEASIINSINSNVPIGRELFEQLFEALPAGSVRAYACVNIIVSEKNNFRNDIDAAVYTKFYDILKTLIYSVFSEHLDCIVIEYDYARFLCIVADDANNICQKIEKSAFELCTCLENDREYLCCAVGAGQAYTDSLLLRSSYLQSATALVHARYLVKGYCSISDVADDEAAVPALTAEDGMAISRLFEQQDKSALSKLLQDIVHRNIALAVPHEQMNALFVNLIESISNRIWLDNRDGVAILQNCRRELDRTDLLIEADYSDRLLLLQEMYEAIFDLINSEEERSTNERFREIKEYINEHYEQDLYLEKISKMFSISSKYLSRRFKELEGISFIEYANRTKIEKAKDFLKNTDLRIEEVAEKVGLPSKTTFLRLFKKYIAVTPSQYRAMWRDFASSETKSDGKSF